VPTPHEDQQSTRWVVHGERSIYENHWVRLTLVDLELPDGERLEHHVVRLRPSAVGVVLDERDRVLMMWRHRFVADRWGWELVGGVVEQDEDPAATVAREVQEETGYRAASVEHLVSFEPNVGMLDSPHHLYLVRPGEYTGEPVEKTEADRLEWVPLADTIDLIERGEIWNAGSLVALLYLLNRRRGEEVSQAVG
jgi:8-oxo-dGTP pyrophosphatase MutT (NUDIX family)